MLEGKKIILGITGSIAAYKAAILVRLLVKAGASVKVIITPAAKDFVTALTLSTLSKNEVLVDLFDENTWANHVMLGRWADAMLIAPLSCNTLAKMAIGACDNLLMAVYLSATCPVIAAPAMDEDMWHHPATTANLQKIKSYGNHVIPVASGELASGLIGEGRMAEPEEIIEYLQQFFSNGKELAGKKALVSAGPTYEPIDPVRFIGNRSSGKMGIAVAVALKNRGASVTLVLGPSSEPLPHGIETIRINTADELYNVCNEIFPEVDIAVMTAAVADYSAVNIASEKLKKKEESFSIELTKTKDVLKSLGEKKTDKQLLVGFALETHNEKEYAQSKLGSKNADLIVMNSLRDAGAGFGSDTNKITIFDNAGNEFEFDLKSKMEVAEDIVNIIVKKVYA